MKILIDTNILIGLEDNRIITETFAKFFRIAITNDCEILYHPKAIPVDINRDKNEERKEIIISKLHKYQKLQDFAIPTFEFMSNLNNNKINDEIDNKQLFQLKKGFVDIFVTQDNGIHKNANKLNLNKKVLKIEQALKLLEEQFTFIIPSHPILQEHSIREIETKFKSPFFDSLREDYGETEFNGWLQKCVFKNRKCYSLIVNDNLQAILIYNIEEIKDHQLPNIYEKALKICTLKVDDTAFGIKLGELFLNKMFELCINSQIKYLYLTVYEKQEHLIRLLEKFGFYRNLFKNNQGLTEIQMIKCLDKTKINISNNEIAAHPFYLNNSNIKKYVIPIQPDFYSTLFKDGKFRSPTLFDKSPGSLNEIQGNTIIKAYISNSKNQKPKKGDLLFFYSSKVNKSIEPFGVLESIQIVTDFDELWRIVDKKTVFSDTKLKEWLEKKGKLHVITFRLIAYLQKNINLVKIKEIDSFKNKIQTITELKETDYIRLNNEGHFDKRYIIN
jgi:ribosomal protein S18 acetylase RimI-like enzyme